MSLLAQSASELSGRQAEPICLPGAVQPHGALLTVDPTTGCVVAASDSCGAILGAPAAILLGLPLPDALRQREAFTQTLMDASPEHLCVLDTDGLIVAVNLAWVRFARANGGHERCVNPIGTSYRKICFAAESEQCGGEAGAAWQGIADVLAGRSEHFTLDYPCDSPSERRWFQMSVHPMQAPGEGALVLHTDITARKRAELAVDVSEQRCRSVLEAQTDLICRYKSDRTILYANPAFCEFFGQSADMLIGRDWQPVVLADDMPQVAEVARSEGRTNPASVAAIKTT